ncbi:MAG TPA: ATPase, T2SS/T4P/T4SS family [Allosphingosinicella sp.]|nr:ATPase, T2SS/T4P/T4SS family [Allosphingosinicella sp.]
MDRPKRRLAARAAEAEAPGEALLGLVADAMRRRASAVHIEATEGRLAVRLRVGGVLRKAVRLREDPAWFMAHVRAVSGLCAESRDLPQEGSFAAPGAAHGVPGEIAVAALPVAGGDRIVLHLAQGDDHRARFEDLGMTPAMADLYARALSRREGLILIAGTGGSGRSTTLKAGVAQLAGGGREIVGAAGWSKRPSPHVREIDGAVSARRGPAAVLSAMLRQDPDVVLPGTVAAPEIAGQAVAAARDGRLVIATVDAPDAVQAIVRLKALKADPFGLASALRLVVAQHLVARLCACRKPVQTSGSAASLLGFDSGAVTFAPRGCQDCAGSGFAGRTGVFESVEPDDALRRLIMNGGDAAVIASIAFRGAPNLGAAARALVRSGVTTAAEAIRLSRGG